MPRLSALLLCLFFLQACQAPPPDTGEIRFGLAVAPVNLDPRTATDAASERINRLIYARLIKYDEHARPVPSLATWRQLTPTHYRFFLGQHGRKFDDGTRLRADDVAATYRSVLDPASASPLRDGLSMIERIVPRDADTVDFYLNRPETLFPGYLTLGILPAEKIAARHPFHRSPIGSGDFHLVSWERDGRLRLQRNSDRQRVSFEQVNDPTMRVLKLLRGEIDLLQGDLPPELLAYLQQRSEIEVQRVAGNTFAYVGFQLQDPVCARPEVRRAIALGIDRRAIVRHLFHGAARQASALLPPEHWAGNPRLAVIEPDPERARALLARAGYGADNRLQLSYKTSSDPLRLRIATILQQQLARIGVDLRIQSYDWGTLFGDIKAGRFQLYGLAWVGIESPDIFRYAFHSHSVPPAGANRGRYTDTLSDALIDQARAAPTSARQADLYRRLQRRLLERLPYVPLWHEDQYAASSARVRGYQVAANGSYDGLREIQRVK